MKKTALISLIGVAMVGTASAQSRSQFVTPASWTGIEITNNGPKNWTVKLTGSPTVTMNNKTYSVSNVYGFWLLDNNDDMTAKGQTISGWNYNQNYNGTGGIAGYRAGSTSSAIKPGGSKSFEFKEVNGSVENVGIKALLTGKGFCDYVYLELPPPAVPEPASLAALGIGAATVIRRRKKK